MRRVRTTRWRREGRRVAERQRRGPRRARPSSTSRSRRCCTAACPSTASLAGALHAYEQGDPSRLRSLYDSYVGRTGYSYDAEWPAFIAISCADGPNLSHAATEALQRQAAAAAPDFGAANIGLGYQCAYWPYPPARTTVGPIGIRTQEPVLVVGTRGDPATPFAWAESLATELGTARLVAVDDAPTPRASTATLPRRDPDPVPGGPQCPGLRDVLSGHRMRAAGRPII